MSDISTEITYDGTTANFPVMVGVSAKEIFTEWTHINNIRKTKGNWAYLKALPFQLKKLFNRRFLGKPW